MRMIKAGIIALGGIFLFLFATHQTHAQSSQFELLSNIEENDICSSPLKLYLLSYSQDCPLPEARQIASLITVKEEKVREFSMAHTAETALYTPTPTIIQKPPIVQSTPVEPDTNTLEEIQTPTPSVDNNADTVLNLVNQHRASIGKSAFITDEALCSLAQTRSTELAAEINNGTLHSGLYNRNLGYWATENAKVGGDENETVRWWLNSSIHRSQIQSDYTNACVGCTGRNCALVFTSHTPKKNQVATTETQTKTE